MNVDYILYSEYNSFQCKLEIAFAVTSVKSFNWRRSYISNGPLHKLRNLSSRIINKKYLCRLIFYLHIEATWVESTKCIIKVCFNVTRGCLKWKHSNNVMFKVGQIISNGCYFRLHVRYLSHKETTLYLHSSFHANYFLLPWKTPEEISRRSMLFHN